MRNSIRIGHIYPSGGISDCEVQRMAPANVNVITTRIPFCKTSEVEDSSMIENIEYHARLLADARVHAIAFNCTAASMFIGSDVINSKIRDSVGIKSICTIDAVLYALNLLGVKKVALFTPYRSEVARKEKVFLERHGIFVAAEAHIPCDHPVDQGEISPLTWANLALSTETSQCDAILFSCSGINVSSIISFLEDIKEIPVISSNSALLCYLLLKLGGRHSVIGYGDIFNL